MNDLDLGWLSGIIDGEGCFAIGMNKRLVYPRFVLASRYDDFTIPGKVKTLIGCGGIYLNEAVRAQCPTVIYAIGSTRDIVEKVCPIFDRLTFYSKKRLEYPLWRELAFSRYGATKCDPKTSRRALEIRDIIMQMRNGERSLSEENRSMIYSVIRPEIA